MAEGTTITGTLKGPMGVCVDECDNIFVADTGNSVIRCFTPAGRHINTWGEYGAGKGQFVKPVAVTAFVRHADPFGHSDTRSLGGGGGSNSGDSAGKAAMQKKKK